MTLPITKQKKEVIHCFNEKFGARNAVPFDEFVDWSLYSHEIGYYRREKPRVGRNQHSDFYTSASIGSQWGELIVAACESILSREKVEDFTFVEIGVEYDEFALHEVEHPFADVQTLRLGDQITIPEKAIVFSNEWLDAQPFKRFRYLHKERKWIELGIAVENDSLREVILGPCEEEAIKDFSPSVENYQIDWPCGSQKALQKVLEYSNWVGLFLTFDYGYFEEILFHEKPKGTARAYQHHRLIDNLLHEVGESDLTCHLCWDLLERILISNGFSQVTVESQEAFLVKYSSKVIKNAFESSKSALDPKIQKLKELILPQYMGRKFQAFWGVRN